MKQLSYSGSEQWNQGLFIWTFENLLVPACQRETRSVDNPNIFNFLLSDIEEICQQWGSTACKHTSLTSNNLDSTSPLVLSHRRSTTFILFRSGSDDQKWCLPPPPPQTALRRMSSWPVPHIIWGCTGVILGIMIVIKLKKIKNKMIKRWYFIWSTSLWRQNLLLWHFSGHYSTPQFNIIILGCTPRNCWL